MKITLAISSDAKAMAMAAVAAVTPRFEMARVTKNGILCLEVRVYNAGNTPELTDVCRRIGMTGTADNNLWSICVYSNEELVAVRDPLRSFFNK